MKNLEELSQEQLFQLQQDLNEFGFDAGKPDGILGPKTRAAWQAATIGDFSTFEDWEVRRVQVHLSNGGFYTGKIDGIPGPRTRHAWRSANLLGTALPEIELAPDIEAVDPRLEDLKNDPVDFDDPMSPKSVALILASEGLDQPGRWPGGASGITIGIGYDIGYYKESEFRRDWAGILTEDELDRLSAAIGKTGSAARAMAPRFSDIKVTRAEAQSVFEKATLPKFEQQAEDAFPGMNVLPADAEGALVSLVFNRGPATSGSRRAEMAEIKRLIQNFDGKNLAKLQSDIADQIRAMKRLWVGKGLDGLLTRRDNEANLVERTA